MATACKLEMSLDEIIKSNKSKTNRVMTGPNARKNMVGKRSMGGGNAKAFGRKQIGGQNLIKKKFGVPKRVGFMGMPKRGVGFNMRRGHPIGMANRFAGGVAMKNVSLQQNRAVISATQNLVNKLVKKALSSTNVSAVNALRGKRLAANRMRRVRTVVLNKVSPRSRVITRQRPRVIAMQQQQQPIILQRVVRGRGPIRFASNTALVPQTANIVSKRRLRRVNSIQQQQPVVLVHQPQRSPQSFSSMSVRQHINAMRRASTVQQLQTQFVNRQQQPIRQSFRGQQQAIIRRPRKQQFIVEESGQQFLQSPVVIQQRGPPRRLRPQPSQQQYVVVQQPFRGQRSQFRANAQQRPFRRQQNQQQLNPMYAPPNFLQRIPMSGGTSFIQY